ncbi:MAG: efflux RND transporter periplasmic adaptor subunit, partial [Caulobacteraceae bacterium]
GLVVRSPTSGVVEAVSAAPGDLVAPGASLGKVGRLSDLRLRLGLDPAMVGQVPIGATVHLRPLAGGADSAGTVRLIDPRLDPQTHFAGVIVAVPGARLSPGQAVRGDIVLGRPTGPVAPRRAVYYDGDKPYLLVVSGGVAHRRDVTLGPTQGETVLVASGVRAGERIVTDGGASLDDGAAVREAPVAKVAP